VFLGKCEFNPFACVMVAGILDSFRQDAGTAEIRSYFCLQLCFASWNIQADLDCLLHLTIHRHPVRTTEHGASAKEGQRVIYTRVIDRDVPKHVLFNLLSQIDIDTKEVGIGLSLLDSLEQSLEPSE